MQEGLLPVPVFYERYTAPAESDPRWSWSGRRPRTASPPWRGATERVSMLRSLRRRSLRRRSHRPSRPVLLQSSVDVLGSSLHEGVTDAGARDGHLLGDGRERRVEPLGRRAGHRAQLAAERHHRVHHHLCTRGTDVSSRLSSFCCRIITKAGTSHLKLTFYSSPNTRRLRPRQGPARPPPPHWETAPSSPRRLVMLFLV